MREYEKIVVGESFFATLYAFSNGYPLFFTDALRPFRFDYLDPDIDLACLKIPTCNKSLTTPQGIKRVGTPKEVLWERMLFLMSLDGLLPVSNLCQSIRYDGERMVCANEYSKILELQFKECVYLGDTGTTGWKDKKVVVNPSYICYDYIEFNRGGKHAVDYIKTADPFVSEIWFYPSDRIDGATAVKDACVVSHLSEEQLKHFDHSETMARFKMISEMESRGMKGLFNGYGPTGQPKYYKFRTTHAHRTTTQVATRARNEDRNHKETQCSEQDLLAALPNTALAYDRFLKYL